MSKVKVKVKFTPGKDMKARTGNGFLALPLTSALDGVEWPTPRLDRYDSLKRPVPTVQKAGGRGPKTGCGKSYPHQYLNPGPFSQ
jgi:hypothetical protein